MAYEKAPRAPRTRARQVRWAVLATILVVITAFGYMHQTLVVGKPAGVDALCPFGGLETLYSLITTGLLLKKIEVAGVILLGATIGMALVFRRSFCGQICPLGFLQELFGGLGRRLFRRRFEMPAVLDRPARMLKYVVLVVFLGLTWTAADLSIRPYDPWATWQHLTSADLLAEFSIGLAVLGVALAGSVLYDRFFCKYLCPMGAFLGIFSRVSMFKVRRNAETCIDCKACDTACPMNINVSAAETVQSSECMSCGECATACPVKDTVTTSTRSGRGLSPLATTGAIVAGFALIVGVTTATGDFRWTAPSFTESVREATDGAPVEQFDVSLIKGSSVLSEVTDAAGIPPEAVEKVLGVPVAEQDRPIKDIKGTYGFTPEDVRVFVDVYRTDPVSAMSFVPAGESGEE
ncbi:MAG: 4Fe-4S binding protein [Coriobacteriia bacterium]